MYKVGDIVYLADVSSAYKDDSGYWGASEKGYFVTKLYCYTVTKINKQSYSMKKEGESKTHNVKFKIQNGKNIICDFAMLTKEEYELNKKCVSLYREFDNVKDAMRVSREIDWYDEEIRKKEIESKAAKEKLEFLKSRKQLVIKRKEIASGKVDGLWLELKKYDRGGN
ncbi:MAG: hypothetical protein ACRCX2_17100 [Paraclostridium sp.]